MGDVSLIGALRAGAFVHKKADRAREIQTEVNAAKEGFKFRLKIKVQRGVNLLNVEDVSKSDPFCILYVGTESRRTHMVVNDLNPIWNKEFDIM